MPIAQGEHRGASWESWGSDCITVYVAAEGKSDLYGAQCIYLNGDGHNDCFGVKKLGRC